MECPKCGWKNKDGANCCASCYWDLTSAGKKVTTTAPKKQTAKPKAVVNAEPVAAPDVTQNGPAPQPPIGNAMPPAAGRPMFAPSSYVNLDYAGFWRRFAAAFIDGLLLWAVNYAVIMVMGMSAASSVAANPGAALPMTPGSTGMPGATPGTPAMPDALSLLMVILQPMIAKMQVVMPILTLINALYYILFNGIKGQTLGKMAVGIRIVKADGAKIGIGTAILRYIMEGILACPTLCFTFFTVAFTQKKQGIHDMIAGTVVVRN